MGSWNTDCTSKVLIMLKINGSALDNHPHPPLFCTAVTDRLVQFKLVLTGPVGRMVWSEETLTCTHTHIKACITVSQSHTHSKTQSMSTRPTRLCYAEIKRVKCSIWRRHTYAVKAAFTQICFILLFPRHLHYPPLCCRSFALILAYPHFVAIIQYGLAFWHACKLANYRTASCHKSDSCGHKRPVEGREVLLVGAGQSKGDIGPACSGLTLLTPITWLTPTAAMICKDLCVAQL